MRALVALVALAGCRQIFGLHELTADGKPPPGDGRGSDGPAIDAPPGYYWIGGTVAGLSGTVVLRDNGGDDLSVMTSGAFMFGTALADGSAYAVTVATQPANQTCSVGNASGSVAGADVTSVAVSCGAAGGDPGVHCDTMTCSLSGATPVCCGVSGTFNCSTSNLCVSAAKFACDDTADCPGVNEVCCLGTDAGGNATGSTCMMAGICASNFILCDPNAAMPCPGNQRCMAAASSGLPPNYYQCL